MFDSCSQQVVLHPVGLGEPDAHGNRAAERLADVLIPGVLCAPGDATDHIEEPMPSGAYVAWTIYVPEEHALQQWRGGSVSVYGRDYDVVGDPQPWRGSPTGYSIVVKVCAYE